MATGLFKRAYIISNTFPQSFRIDGTAIRIIQTRGEKTQSVVVLMNKHTAIDLACTVAIPLGRKPITTRKTQSRSELMKPSAQVNDTTKLEHSTYRT